METTRACQVPINLLESFVILVETFIGKHKHKDVLSIKPLHMRAEEEVRDVPGCTRLNPRRCYTSISETHPRGSFYPNYQTHNNAITGLSRPTLASGIRDENLDPVCNEELKAKMGGILPDIGVVYVGVGGPGVLDGTEPWDYSDAGTWWLLEHNGKLVGVTALHIFRFAAPFKIYINTTTFGNLKAERESFHRQDVNIVDFVEVKLRTDLLDVREKYIRELHAKQDVTKAAENLDPEYQLHFGVTCDIAFLDLEHIKEALVGRPRIKLATKEPDNYTFNATIGYISSGPWKQKELEEEFSASVINMSPPENLYFADIRSVSLGQVQKVGKGLITDISTMEEMSCGSPKMLVEDNEFRAFGIAVGSYNDKVNPRVYAKCHTTFINNTENTVRLSWPMNKEHHIKKNQSFMVVSASQTKHPNKERYLLLFDISRFAATDATGGKVDFCNTTTQQISTEANATEDGQSFRIIAREMLYDSNFTPKYNIYTDSESSNHGVKFETSVPGKITGAQVYCISAHPSLVTLWSQTGEKLAHTAVVPGSNDGWINVLFPNSVQIVASTTYPISYFSSKFVYVLAGFSTGRTVGQIKVTANAAVNLVSQFVAHATKMTSVEYFISPIFVPNK